MRANSRSIGAAMITLAVLACGDDSLFNGDASVELVAEVRQAEKLVVLTVANRGSDTVYYHAAWLEQREGDGEWERVQPPDVVLVDNVDIEPIEPGREFVLELDLDPALVPVNAGGIFSDWMPGEYRFRVSLSADGKGSSSEDAGASNAFQIEP